MASTGKMPQAYSEREKKKLYSDGTTVDEFTVRTVLLH